MTTPNGLIDFARAELGWGADLGWRPNDTGEDDDTSEGAEAWRRLLALEAFLCFGAAMCADLVLSQAALLPLRGLHAAVGAAAGAARAAVRMVNCGRDFMPLRWAPAFTRAGLFDLIKLVVIATATAALGQLQVSRVYHYVRGEAVIKLYVIFNILDIVDKLCASTGTDVWDGLYSTVRDDSALAATGVWLSTGTAPATRSARTAATLAPLRLAARVAAAVAYTTLHAAVVLVQIVCLTVALHSRNGALLTLLISNNFVELKSCVFKRYEPANLFQVACADAVERFTLALSLCLILMLEGAAPATLAAAAVMWAAELAVDGIKHAYVTSFNRLRADLYGTFAAIAAQDYVAVRGRMRASLDPAHAAARRLGLAPLPLLCVLLRLGLTHAGPWLRRSLASPLGLAVLALAALCLVLAKLALGMGLLVVATSVIDAQRARTAAAASRSRAGSTVPKPQPPPSLPESPPMPQADSVVALPASVADAAAAAMAAAAVGSGGSLPTLVLPVGLRQRLATVRVGGHVSAT